MVCNSMANLLGTVGSTQILLVMASFKRISETMIIKDKEKHSAKIPRKTEYFYEEIYSFILNKC